MNVNLVKIEVKISQLLLFLSSQCRLDRLLRSPSSWTNSTLKGIGRGIGLSYTKVNRIRATISTLREILQSISPSNNSLNWSSISIGLPILPPKVERHKYSPEQQQGLLRDSGIHPRLISRCILGSENGTTVSLPP
jgi:hypothetical protein